jgi:hypothetical protein
MAHNFGLIYGRKPMAYKGTDPTYNKALGDEPIFCLRSTDKLAPVVVELWAVLAENLGTPKSKIDEARRCVTEMYMWQQDNPDKVKIPD